MPFKWNFGNTVYDFTIWYNLKLLLQKQKSTKYSINKSNIAFGINCKYEWTGRDETKEIHFLSNNFENVSQIICKCTFISWNLVIILKNATINHFLIVSRKMSKKCKRLIFFARSYGIVSVFFFLFTSYSLPLFIK